MISLVGSEDQIALNNLPVSAFIQGCCRVSDRLQKERSLGKTTRLGMECREQY